MARTSYVFRRPILKTPNTSCVILFPSLHFLEGLGISFWLSADIHTDGAELLYSLWYRGWSNHHLGWWFCLLSLSVVIRCLVTALVWQAQDHSDDEWPIITCNYQLLSPQYTDIIRDIILLLEEEQICQMSVVIDQSVKYVFSVQCTSCRTQVKECDLETQETFWLVL